VGYLRTQIEFGLSVLAYLMVSLARSTVVRANPDADWRYYVALLPLAPAGFVIWLFVRALAGSTSFKANPDAGVRFLARAAALITLSATGSSRARACRT